MYSPKIPDRLIPPLYRLGQARGRPMTHLVAEAVERYLAAEGWVDGEAPGNVTHVDFARRDDHAAA